MNKRVVFASAGAVLALTVAPFPANGLGTIDPGAQVGTVSPSASKVKRILVVKVRGVPRPAKVTVSVRHTTQRKSRWAVTTSRRAKVTVPAGTYRVAVEPFIRDGRRYSADSQKVLVKKSKKKPTVVLLRLGSVPVFTGDGSLPYQQKTPAGGIVPVSASKAGVLGDKPSGYPQWNPAGSSVWFTSCATNLTGDGAALKYCYPHQKQLVEGDVSRLASVPLDETLDDSVDSFSGEVAVSPSGKHLAVDTWARLTTEDTDSAQDVYVVDSSDGGNPVKVSAATNGLGLYGNFQGWDWAYNPRWSPDETKVAFVTDSWSLDGKQQDGNADVYVKNLSDKTLQRFSSGRMSETPSWSPDGTRLVFAGDDPEGSGDFVKDSDLFMGTTASGEVIRLTTSGEAYAPAWSPDGTRIAFVSNGSLFDARDGNEASDVYVRDMTTGATHRISVGLNGEESLWDSSAPVWSPDSTRIAYLANSEDGATELVVKNVASGAVSVVTRVEEGYDALYDVQWSPQGDKVAYTVTSEAYTRTIVPGQSSPHPQVYTAIVP